LDTNFSAATASRGGASFSDLPRGVDRGQFRPSRRSRAWRRAHGIADQDVVLLFFRRLVVEKGLAVFAAAVGELRRLATPVSILIVGDGPERRHLKRMLLDAVFTSHLDDDALARAIASAAILLNLSVTDAFGNVTLEAMASAVVPIATDVPANQLLIEPVTPATYAIAVQALVTAPQRLEEMASAGAGAAKAFRWDETLYTVLAGYREVVCRTETNTLGPGLQSMLQKCGDLVEPAGNPAPAADIRCEAKRLT